MSILSALRTYLATYSALESGAELGVDFMGPDQVGYAIITMPGAKKIPYITSGSERTFPFAFQATLQTADDTTRIENSGFFETLSDWFDTQTEVGALPSLPSGKTAEKIEALDCGYLYQEGTGGTGIYQIQCCLTYTQV
jgi:hypothetical protein